MSIIERIKKIPYTPIQIAMHLYAWSALVVMTFDLFTNHLTANPIEAMEQLTGRHTIALLVLSLACTPLNTLFGWRELLKRRRALGLYALMYATIHVLIFVNLDYGLAWSLIIQTVVQRSYIVFGLIVFIILIPLGLTSFDIWKMRLGKKWKLLHQAIYLAAPIAVLHYALATKGDIFHLSGNIEEPLIYGGVVLLLLFLRLPFIRRSFSSLRSRVVSLFFRFNAQRKFETEKRLEDQRIRE
jgi:methionine sulfoxide reductase heme-binding subunit